MFFQLFFFTFGMYRLSNEKKIGLKSLVKSPLILVSLVSIGIYLSPFRLPDFIQGAVKGIGDMMVPLSTILIGCSLVGILPAELLKDRNSYLVSALRLVIFPLITLLLAKLAGLHGAVGVSCVVLAGLPSGTLNVIVAQKNECAPEFAARAAIHGTVFMAVTLPVLIYIAMIFIFAIIYNCFPNEFYHSSIQKETSYKQHKVVACAVIKQSLINAIEKNLPSEDGNKRKFQYRESAKADNKDSIVAVSDYLEYLGSEQIKLFTHVSIVKDHETIGEMELEFILELLDNEWENGTIILADSEDNEVKKQEVFIKKILSMADATYSVSHDPISFKLIDVKVKETLAVNSETTNLLKEISKLSKREIPVAIDIEKSPYVEIFLQESEGIPSSKVDNFLRLLYFSAVTVTSVGFGDIVPLTIRARMLVGLEAVSGLIIIGLFLNSLTEKIQIKKTIKYKRRKPSDRKD
jgi:hypothetical protein